MNRCQKIQKLAIAQKERNRLCAAITNSPKNGEAPAVDAAMDYILNELRHGITTQKMKRCRALIRLCAARGCNPDMMWHFEKLKLSELLARCEASHE